LPVVRAQSPRISLAALLVGAIGGITSSSAFAADDAALSFYQGKQIRIFTMGSPGGGYDTYTRTVGAFLERKLGAKVIPTNEPAAGGMIAMNRTLNAPPDGLTLLLTGGEAASDGAALRPLGRQLRCAQAGVARTRFRRGQGRGGRAAVTHWRCD
jgi:tripartite-type tricarboxylate transporter receptor subunit TctC